MHANSPEYYIGIMSGTSLDGVDVSLIAISKNQKNQKNQQVEIESIANLFTDLPQELITQIKILSTEPKIDVIALGQMQSCLAHFFAVQVNNLLATQSINADQVTAIGCHGITIRHFPDLEHGFTMQITDANKLAQLTGIDVISDFRGMDVAAGGQGAPLVPPFHQTLFSSDHNRFVLSLGGIAYVSLLTKNTELLGFDTGPANTLLDLWCQEHTEQPFDQNGQWAATGQYSPELLKLCLAEPYFQQDYPKSTGKEKFNLGWLEQQLNTLSVTAPNVSLRPQDIQATLVHLTAKSIANQCEAFDVDEVIVCGGGANNHFLMSVLSEYFAEQNAVVYSSETLNVDPNAVEAMAFAWLAYCRVHTISANVTSVTGAKKQVVMGAWYSVDGDNR